VKRSAVGSTAVASATRGVCIDARPSRDGRTVAVNTNGGWRFGFLAFRRRYGTPPYWYDAHLRSNPWWPGCLRGTEL